MAVRTIHHLFSVGVLRRLTPVPGPRRRPMWTSTSPAHRLREVSNPLSGNQGAAFGSPPCFRNAHKPPGGPRPTGSLSQACGATRLDSIVRMINETALAYEPEERAAAAAAPKSCPEYPARQPAAW